MGRIFTHRENCRYWASDNPNFVATISLHSPNGVVWISIWRGGLLGPFFHEGTVIISKYVIASSSRWKILVNGFASASRDPSPTFSISHSLFVFRWSNSAGENRRTGDLEQFLLIISINFNILTVYKIYSMPMYDNKTLKIYHRTGANYI